MCAWPDKLFVFVGCGLFGFSFVAIAHVWCGFKDGILFGRLVEFGLSFAVFAAPIGTSPFFHFHHCERERERERERGVEASKRGKRASGGSEQAGEASKRGKRASERSEHRKGKLLRFGLFPGRWLASGGSEQAGEASKRGKRESERSEHRKGKLLRLGLFPGRWLASGGSEQAGEASERGKRASERSEHRKETAALRALPWSLARRGGSEQAGKRASERSDHRKGNCCASGSSLVAGSPLPLPLALFCVLLFWR
jgi:hypothetical protein